MKKILFNFCILKILILLSISTAYSEDSFVLSPNGGEVIPSGSGYDIRWEKVSGAVKLDLLYSLNNGTTWKPAINGGSGGCTDCHSIHSIHTIQCTDCHSIDSIHEIHMNTNTESYNWKVPCPTNNKKNCLIKVIGYNAAAIKVGEDVSDATFIIEVVKLISPNGRQTLKSGTTWRITWQTNCTTRPVARVELQYTPGGGIWNPIMTLEGNPKSYSWTVPVVSSTKCKVKVILKDASGKTVGSDLSDGVFTIQP